MIEYATAVVEAQTALHDLREQERPIIEKRDAAIWQLHQEGVEAADIHRILGEQGLTLSKSLIQATITNRRKLAAMFAAERDRT